MPEPIDKALYERIKKKVKRQVKVWPSAYASGMLVKQYKSAGGRYKGSKPTKKGIGRWFREEWIDVCKLPQIVKCGRKKSEMKNYPYCRPRVRVDSQTPKLASELTKEQIKKRCAKKKSNPQKRIIPKSRRKTRKSTRKKTQTKNGKILNPKTGRYVSKTGKLGKQILSRKR
jgi:hypothetical protein